MGQAIMHILENRKLGFILVAYSQADRNRFLAMIQIAIAVDFAAGGKVMWGQGAVRGIEPSNDTIIYAIWGSPESPLIWDNITDVRACNRGDDILNDLEDGQLDALSS